MDLIKKMPVVLWTGKDVIALFCCFFLVTIILTPFSSVFAFYGDFIIFSIIDVWLTFFIVIFIRKKYNLTIDALGCRRGLLSIIKILFTGITVGILVAFLSSIFFVLESSTCTFKFIFFHFLNKIMQISINIVSFQVIVSAPISEEIFFRGFIYGYFRKKHTLVLSLLIQSFLFAAVHFPNMSNFLYLFFLGIIFAFIYEITGSLYPAMIIHVIINFSAMVINSAIC